MLEYIAMNIADVFDWFGRESMEAGEQATEWEQRETFLKLARLWAAAAQRVRKEENGITLPFIMPRREAEMSRRDRSSLNQHVEAQGLRKNGFAKMAEEHEQIAQMIESRRQQHPK